MRKCYANKLRYVWYIFGAERDEEIEIARGGTEIRLTHEMRRSKSEKGGRRVLVCEGVEIASHAVMKNLNNGMNHVRRSTSRER